ncbi:MAG TPA: hypothetical protein DD414_01540 [Lachnospiraceae bacterium]|nr:hypothetical protein [Lachnospiraceae bacterium]
MDKKKKIIVGSIVILLLVIIGVLLFLLLRKEPEEDTTGYVLDEGNYQQIQGDMANEVAEGYFQTYMNTTWTFADGTSETQDAVLGNSPDNTKPIRCEVILEDTGEIVYKTGVLPVGAVLEPFKLDKDLDAGTYKAVCQTYLLKEQENGTYEDFSSAGFYVTIEVEN